MVIIARVRAILEALENNELTCGGRPLISGTLPFTSDNDFALLHQHLEKEPPLLSTVAPDVPAFIDEAIFKAMRKLPEDRFSSCREMSDFLRLYAPTLPPKAVYADLKRSIRRPWCSGC